MSPGQINTNTFEKAGAWVGGAGVELSHVSGVGVIYMARDTDNS